MGSATEIGYGHRRANPVQRGVQAVGSTRPGAWAFARVLPPLDRLTHRVSKGRTSLPEVLAGLPVVMVTTTGRRSGQPRTTPLIAVPVGDDLALLGTNFGGPSTPAWVHNLEADPRASVEYRGRRAEVVARPATDEERARVWAASSGVYGGYTKYRSRVTDREIRIFVLEPADEVGPRT
jgi:deazaflavin-dependent oxidoreductase (nitroreductase family)